MSTKTDKPTTFSDVVKTVCTLSGERVPNQDDKGICYGIISPHDVSPYALDEIYMNGRDLNYEAWREETEKLLMSILEASWPAGTKEVPNCLAETLALALKCHDELYGCSADALADMAVDNDGDPAKTADDMTDELASYYESQGDAVMYHTEGVVEDNPELAVQIDSLGLWVFKSQFVTMCRECSMCAPNAGDLNAVPGSKLTYCLPLDWFEKEKAPYPVWEIVGDNDFELIYVPPALREDCAEEIEDSGAEFCACGNRIYTDETMDHDSPQWNGFCSTLCMEKLTE